MIEQKYEKRNKVISLSERRQENPLAGSRRDKESQGRDSGESSGIIIPFGRHIFGNDLKECIYNYNKDGSSFFVYRLVPRKEIVDARMMIELKIEKSGVTEMVDDLKISVESRIRSGVPYLEVIAREVEATKEEFDGFCKALRKLVEKIAQEV